MSFNIQRHKKELVPNKSKLPDNIGYIAPHKVLPANLMIIAIILQIVFSI
jgi:hypothetical protein